MGMVLSRWWPFSSFLRRFIEYSLTSLNPACPPAFCDRRAICATLDFVRVQVPFEQANRLTTKGTFHFPHTSVAEIESHETVPVVVFLTEFVKPTVDEGRDTALLGADCGVLSL